MYKYKNNFFCLKIILFHKIRLDKLLSFYLIYFSRNFIINFIKKKNLYINNFLKKDFFINKNIFLKFFVFNILNKVNLNYKKIFIPIIYEDNYLIVINKPKGLIIHPVFNNWNSNLVESLFNYYGKKILFLFRLGILHRLDFNTNGLILIFKSNFFYINFLKQIKYNILNKYYFSLNLGKKKKNNKIIGYINYFYKKKKYNLNFFSITNFFCFKNFFLKKKIFLIKSNLITGRTHQLRIHFNFINFPIIGDYLYNNFFLKYNIRQILQCYNINFFHPNYNLNLIFKIPLSYDILNFIFLFFRDGGIWTHDSI